MKKIINGICIVLGFVFLGIGLIGIVIPVLPTTPFLLLTAILFAKGSERFHRWFTNTRLYQEHIDQIIKEKKMNKTSKMKIIISLSILFALGVIIAPIWHAKIAIGVIAVIHYYYFLFKIKTT